MVFGNIAKNNFFHTLDANKINNTELFVTKFDIAIKVKVGQNSAKSLRLKSIP